MKTSELTGVQLDWAVAKAEGCAFKPSGFPGRHLYATVDRPIEWLWLDMFNPSTSWAQGGPIIGRELIDVTRCNDLYFPKGNENGDLVEPYFRASMPDKTKVYGPNVLVAAMRCYVFSKLGESVDLPPELENRA